MKVLMYPHRDAQGMLQVGGVQRSVRNLKTLEREAQLLGIRNSIVFCGAVHDMERLKSLYSGAQTLVLPSRSEGLGNVLLEAGACGTVCIGSEVGGYLM